MIGSRLGPYEITAKLGEGGMGEVYRARDTKLEREVAIKVLPAALARDAEALARFEREAKAVATLSHPNILAIFDFGREGETAYAAMELLDGETLGARLGAGALPARKALEVATQVARGLAAAHERRIVHRDVKPDNLFLTRDGQVKILDFGLARQQGPHVSQSQLLAAPTLAQGAPATAPGAVLGTVGYMAPEQVRGEPADARSDLFALGVVLYEMLTGRRAFARASAVETMSAILTADPPELEALAERFSPAVARAVAHALEKRPEERFQSARDFAFELQSLAAGGSSSGRGERQAALASPRSRRGTLVAATTLAAGVALGWLVATLAFRDTTSVDGMLRPTFRQLTKLPGGEGQPSVAPDGESFVYVQRDGGDLDLFVQRVDGAKPIALTADCDQDDYDPAFSPDGRRIAYRSECDGGGVFVSGATGESRRRVADFGYAPAWSPDGRELAVVTERLEAPTSRNSISALWAVRVDSGAQRLLSEHDAMGPTWSPDGRRVAFWGIKPETFQRDLWSVAADGSESAVSAAVPYVDDADLDWAPVYSADGRWLYFASTRGGTLNLWRLPLAPGAAAAGAPEPVIAPSSSAGPFSLSADGRRLLYTDRNISSAIVRAAYDPARGALAAPPVVTFSASFELREQKISPSGRRIVFSNEDMPQQLHVVDADGGGYRQITEGNDRNRQGDWSPDEQWIVFQTSRGDSALAVVRPDGGGRQQLPVGLDFSTPRWSPDGGIISAYDYSTAAGGVWIDVAAGLGAAKAATLDPIEPGTFFWPHGWSPDGRLQAGRAARDGRIGDVVVRDRATGAYRRLAGTASAGKTSDFNVTFVDRSTVVYTDNWSLWVRGVDEERSTLLYRPPTQRQVESITASRDGRTLTWIEKADESDIWLMTLDGGPTPGSVDGSR